MATPITHIVLTEKVFNKYFSDKNKEDFYIGTIFPDIRYLGVIDRDKTHFPLKCLKLEDIKKEQNSFIAGLKFHSLIDDIREKFVKSKDIYLLIPESKYKIQTLKILEDELYYNKVNNWKQFINFLDNILPEELSFNIKEKDIGRWHNILQDYFSQKPDKQTIWNFANGLNFSEESKNEIIDLIKQIRLNDKIKHVIEEFYNNFDKLLV
ncbi:hypothetical protein KKA23_00925 [Patescibacteria group bacterium]|nr:hypothetical protein [Patescibacteria group bacterium]MBU3923211.1 hypothetical protein [Patescibacteria group bacterium]